MSSLFGIFRRAQSPSPPKSKLIDTFYKPTEPSLPQDFATKVIELEMQLEFGENSNLEVIQQLNQLYRTAVEYYVDVDSRKATHFQRKLAALLNHPHTLQAISKRAPVLKQSENRSQSYAKSLQQQLSKFHCSSKLLVRSMLEGINCTAEKSNRLIRETVETQEEKLIQRRQERSKAKSHVDIK